MSLIIMSVYYSAVQVYNKDGNDGVGNAVESHCSSFPILIVN